MSLGWPTTERHALCAVCASLRNAERRIEDHVASAVSAQTGPEVVANVPKVGVAGIRYQSRSESHYESRKESRISGDSVAELE